MDGKNYHSGLDLSPPPKRQVLDPAFEVPFFWDFENSEPSSTDLIFLEDNINGSLKTVDSRYHLAKEKYGAGNKRLDFVQNNGPLLHQMGFVMEDSVKYYKCNACTGKQGDFAGNYERVKEVADRMIVQRLQRHLLMGSPSRNILLASGDADFVIPLQFLKDKGYTIFLAIICGSKVELRRCGHHVWAWEEMANAPTARMWSSKP